MRSVFKNKEETYSWGFIFDDKIAYENANFGYKYFGMIAISLFFLSLLALTFMGASLFYWLLLASSVTGSSSSLFYDLKNYIKAHGL